VWTHLQHVRDLRFLQYLVLKLQCCVTWQLGTNVSEEVTCPSVETQIYQCHYLHFLLTEKRNSQWFFIAVPSGAPVDIRTEARSSTELFVSWEPPERELWNGNLLGYYVGYQEQSLHATVSSAPSTTTHSYNFKTVEVGAHYGGEVLLQGLAKYTTYSIVVQAYNSRGAGPSSEQVTACTQEDG
jgi:hypothetical protein